MIPSNLSSMLANGLSDMFIFFCGYMPLQVFFTCNKSCSRDGCRWKIYLASQTGTCIGLQDLYLNVQSTAIIRNNHRLIIYLFRQKSTPLFGQPSSLGQNRKYKIGSRKRYDPACLETFRFPNSHLSVLAFARQVSTFTCCLVQPQNDSPILKSSSRKINIHFFSSIQ